MQYAIKDLPKSQKEVTVTVEADELKPFMERAASDISQKVKIEGFRPGKASYEVVAKRVGEMAILEEALPKVVRKQLVEIIQKESLETVGEPSVEVQKAAPGNETVFNAKLTLLPAVKKLADVADIKIAPKDVTVKDEDLDRTMGELRKMQSIERDVDREVRKGDKATVDMSMAIDHVTVEGGATRGHGIYIDEPYYVPGLNEQIIGMKKGEKKVFTLPFPKDHFNKMLKGKDVEFTVELKGVHEIVNPELDDDFAKKLGQESFEKLRTLLRKNLQDEADVKETQRQEIAAIEELNRRSDIDEVPDLLVTNEARKMVHELEHSVVSQGGDFGEYLKSIKKTQEELLLEFAPQAMARVKSMVLMRAIAKQENLSPDDKEVLDEQLQMLNMYADDAEMQDRVRSEDGEEYIRNMLRNRKVLAFLREKTIQK